MTKKFNPKKNKEDRRPRRDKKVDFMIGFAEVHRKSRAGVVHTHYRRIAIKP